MDGMKHDWKPGDMAIRKSAVDSHTLTTVATTCFLHEGQGLHWHHVGGGWDQLHTEGGPTYRRLVVIDPEDREQVERLHDLIDAAENDSMDDYALDEDSARLWAVGAVETALREFANPTPRIEEPTGLGAVVEAINDNHFVRVGSAGWVHVDDHGGNPCNWEDIAAVRVLSEGVQA